MGEEVAATKAGTMDGESLAIALDAAAVGTWDWDLASGELIFSNTLEVMFGLEPGTFGQTFDSFNALVHPDDQHRVADAIERARSEGIPYEIEYVICPPGRDHRWVAAKGQVMRDARDEPVRMIGVVWEITQRKEAETVRREEYLRVLVEHGTDIVSIIDVNGVRRYMSPVIKHVLGYEPEDVVGDTAGNLVHPDDAERQRLWIAAVHQDPSRILREEIRVRHKDGSWRHLEMTASNRLDDPMVQGIVLTSRDVTERIEADAALAAERDLLQTIIDSLPDPVYFKDTASRFIRLNQAAARSLGRETVDEVLGKTDLDFFPPEVAARFRAGEQHLFETGEPLLKQLEAQSLSATEQRWLRTSKIPLLDDDGKVTGLVGSGRDVTEHRRTEDTLRQERTFLSEVLENAAEGIVACDANANLTLFNRAAREFHGLMEASIPPERWAEHYSLYQADGQRLLAPEDVPLLRALRGETVHDVEFMIVPEDGTPRTVLTSGGQLLDDDGNTAGAVAVMHDITEQKALQEQLIHNALHDPLTGLPNRTFLRDRLIHSLSSRRREAEMVAVLCIDLDHFKVINDSLGHARGDSVLVAIAQRLLGQLRTGDTLSRFGGDEFVVLIDGVADTAEAHATALRLQSVLQESLSVEGQTVFVGGSIGIATSRVDHHTGDDLIREADLAMYQAKSAGRGGIAFYDSAMGDRAHERTALELDFRQALDRDELRLYYQPEVDLQRGEILGVEALVRWEHPIRGLVPPADFVPFVEETAFVAPLGEWVLRQACEQIRAWRKTEIGARIKTVNINISARNFQQPHFPQWLARLLAEMEIPPDSLGLEITEGALIEDSYTAWKNLQELKRLGIGVALDDFGTGYSSLSYLSKLPVDMLKIDRTFVSRIDRDYGKRAIVKAISDLGVAFGIVVMAEGIEREEEVAVLRQLGVERGQGYYFGEPAPAADLATWLRAGRPPRAEH